jgi:hypothetical protein
MSIKKTHVVFHKSSRGTHQRRSFVPKKYLEDVLDNMKGKVLVVRSPRMNVLDLNETKIKKHGRRKKREFQILILRKKYMAVSFPECSKTDITIVKNLSLLLMSTTVFLLMISALMHPNTISYRICLLS